MRLARQNKRWSAGEDRLLVNLWGEATLRGLAAKLGRTQSAAYQRAQLLDLPLGFPDGCESPWRAAQRTGIDVEALRRILDRAGVKVRRTMSRPIGRQRRPWHFVDAFEVDEAVKAHLATESIAGAARRLGVRPATVKRKVGALGGLPPRPEKPGQAWRIPSEVIDRAIGRAA